MCRRAGFPDDVSPYGEPPLTVEERVPEWVKDAVFYQLFPERFRNGDPSNDPTHASLEFPDITPTSWAVKPWTQDWYYRQAWEREMGPDFYEHGVFHRRLGGDLQGVLDQMDYLADLGINVIYFNPVFYARSLHKYDGNSFHHVEPHFGPDPAGDLALIAQEDPMDPETRGSGLRPICYFLDVLDAAHERGIRVIIDGVFNHTGRDFPAFADIVQNQAESRFRDWYVIHEFDDPDDRGERVPLRRMVGRRHAAGVRGGGR
jgi:cyclomaltodextrinase / maltogenic alpha-amylase / neopullulanase